MKTLFVQQTVQYEMQGDYKIPCLTLPNDSDYEINVWAKRHRRYLKEHHNIRYYNLMAAITLVNYLADIKIQTEKLFEKKVKTLVENKNVTKNLISNFTYELGTKNEQHL